MFEADVLEVESGAKEVAVVVVGLESDWSLDLEHCLYQPQHHYDYPPFLVF